MGGADACCIRCGRKRKDVRLTLEARGCQRKVKQGGSQEASGRKANRHEVRAGGETHRLQTSWARTHLSGSWSWSQRWPRVMWHGWTDAPNMERLLQGFPGALPWGKESTCQCRRHRFNLWSRKIPHVVCCGAAEPVHHNYWSPHTLEPVIRKKRSCYNEKPVQHNEE